MIQLWYFYLFYFLLHFRNQQICFLRHKKLCNLNLSLVLDFLMSPETTKITNWSREISQNLVIGLKGENIANLVSWLQEKKIWKILHLVAEKKKERKLNSSVVCGKKNSCWRKSWKFSVSHWKKFQNSLVGHMKERKKKPCEFCQLVMGKI